MSTSAFPVGRLWRRGWGKEWSGLEQRGHVRSHDLRWDGDSYFNFPEGVDWYRTDTCRHCPAKVTSTPQQLGD